MLKAGMFICSSNCAYNGNVAKLVLVCVDYARAVHYRLTINNFLALLGKLVIKVQYHNCNKGLYGYAD